MDKENMIRKVFSGISCVILFAVILCSGAAYGQSGTGVVKGTVYNSDGTTPVSGAYVTLYERKCNYYGASDPFTHSYVSGQNTDTSGYYEFTSLPDGDYVLVADFHSVTGMNGFFVYGNTHNKSYGTLINVNGGIASADANFTYPTGSIEGNVYEADGTTGVSGATVIVYAYSGGEYIQVAYTNTDTSGMYQVAGLISGDYVVEVDFGYSYSYATVVYPSAGTLAGGTQISVTTGPYSSNIDVSLPLGGFHGYVYDSDGTTGVSGAYLGLYKRNGSSGSYSYDYITYVYADLSGYYEFIGLPDGDYILEGDFGGSYGNIEIVYPDAADYPGGTAIPISGGIYSTDVNLVYPTGSIHGYTYDADGSTAATGSTVTIYRKTDAGSYYLYKNVTQAYVDTSGYFEASGLVDGTYVAEVRYGFAYGSAQFMYGNTYDRDLSTELAISGGAAYASDVNFTLPTGAVNGNVYDSDGTTAVENVVVRLYRASGTSHTQVGSYVYTDTAGHYEITGLLDTEYFVKADYGSAYNNMSIIYPNVYALDQGTGVTVSSGQIVNGIDFSFPAGSIHGYLYESDGSTPIESGYVAVYQRSGSSADYLYDRTVYVYTDASGYYNVTGLVNGDYVVETNFGRSVTIIYNNKHEYYDNADIISVSGGAYAGDVNFTYPGGAVHGYVYGYDGSTPVDGASISFYERTGSSGAYSYNYVTSTYTDDTGYYNKDGLYNGDYVVKVYYPSEYGNASFSYPNAPDFDSATVIPVSGAPYASDVNFSLPSGSIQGYVYESDGTTPVHCARVEVYKYDSSGNYPYHASAGYAETDSNGFYQLMGLANGDYVAQGSSFFFTTQVYQNVYSLSDGTMISVQNGQATTGINFSFASGSISGYLYQGDGTTPLDYGYVNLYIRQGSAGSYSYIYMDYVSSDSSGSYHFGGLPDGDYIINANGDGYAMMVYQNAADFDSGTPVTITSGSEQTGINFVFPNGSFSGNVVDESGAPIDNAGVEVYLRTGTSGAYNFDWIGSTYTDSSGIYEIKGLADGTYVARAGRYGYGYVVYDNAAAFDQGTGITISDGPYPSAVNFQLPVSTGDGSISGDIYDSTTGLCLSEGWVTVLDHVTGGYISGVPVLSFGHYEVLGLPDGTYDVIVNAQSYAASSPTVVEVNVGANAGVTDVTQDIYLEPVTTSVDLLGSVEDASTALPVADASVNLVNLGETGTTDTNGAFSFSGLPAYVMEQLRVSDTGYKDTYSAFFETGNVLHMFLPLVPETLYNQTVSDLSADSSLGVITGRIDDSNGPVSGAVVRAYQINDNGSMGASVGRVVYSSGTPTKPAGEYSGALSAPAFDSSLTSTGADGSFVIVDVPIGVIEVQVETSATYIPSQRTRTFSGSISFLSFFPYGDIDSLPLEIYDVSPPAASTTGGVCMMYGSGFKDGLTVTLGGSYSCGVEVLSPWECRLTIPALSAGDYTGIQAELPDGSVDQLNDAVFYVRELASLNTTISIPVAQTATTAPLQYQYRMVSIPAFYIEGYDVLLESVFGPYDPYVWRAFGYHDGVYTEYDDAKAQGHMTYHPGEAFWIISWKGADFIPQGFTLSSSEYDCRIWLEPGWNQIGNPFAETMAWASGAVSNPHSEQDYLLSDSRLYDGSMDLSLTAPYAYDGNGGYNLVEDLEPGVGYWVKNNSPFDVVVLLGHHGVTVTKVEGLRKSDAPGVLPKEACLQKENPPAPPGVEKESASGGGGGCFVGVLR